MQFCRIYYLYIEVMPRKSKEEETGNEEHKLTLDDIEYTVDLACTVLFIINTNTNEVITYF